MTIRTASFLRIAAVVTTALLLASPTAADQIQLANGDRLSGTIVEMNDEHVVIETAYGRFEVKRDAVVLGQFGTSSTAQTGTTSTGAATDAPSTGSYGAAAAATAADGSAAGTTAAAATAAADTSAARASADATHADIAASSSSIPDDSLLFHFPLNASLTDATGRRVLANNGLRFASDAKGVARNALRSDGSGTYLSVASDDVLGKLSSFTLAFLIRVESADSTHYLASKWNRATGDTADGKFTLQLSGANLTLFLVGPDGAYSWLAARNALDATNWHAVAVTFSAGRGVIYVDGTEAASRTFSFSDLDADTSPILFMTAASDSTDGYAHYNTPGSIDDIRLYSRALGATEVASLASVIAN